MKSIKEVVLEIVTVVWNPETTHLVKTENILRITVQKLGEKICLVTHIC